MRLAERGYLMADALMTVLAVAWGAAAGYSLLAASVRQSNSASTLTAATAALAEGAARLKLQTRSMENPCAAEPPAEGLPEITVDGWQINLHKEVIGSCPGLSRWTLSAEPPGGIPPGERAALLVGVYDPF